ncbi:hypothetical protein QCA50_015242 [Cerrena zonata]|uniref:Cyclin-like domain-containing protein n=1 Tax=Cerrena zonata TaxID=2478898 RepID=A0AAW0FJ87_9APHY
MATDFWESSHHKRWIVDRATLQHARSQDLLYVDDPDYLDFLGIFFANLIAKLGKKLGLRQRVIATAVIFFRRFYVKNAYCETDPFIVIAACCYVAAKAEESPVHIKNVVTEARLLFSNEEIGVKSFPSDNSKLAEMEFYLVDDLECDLVVFHPYRTLMALCGKEGQIAIRDAEAGEMGAGIDDGPRYWGTGEGKLELNEGAVQLAWFIINDTYRSNICLLYPPHLIAIAALFLTVVLHSSTHAQLHNAPSSSHSSNSHTQSQGPQKATPRRSSRPTNSTLKKHPQQDIVAFLAGLNVNMSLIATIAQEIISLYTLWERYKEDSTDSSARTSFNSNNFNSNSISSVYSTSNRLGSMRSGSAYSGGSTSSAGTPTTNEDIIMSGSQHGQFPALGRPAVVTPSFLTQMLLKMREAKMTEVAGGIPRAHDKHLERARAAG